MLDAWNRRDAAAYAGLVHADGLMIGFDGSQMTGLDAEREVGAIFASHPTAAYVAKVRQVRPLGPHTALLSAIAGMVPPGQQTINPRVNALHTLIAERRGGTWRVLLFQNTPAQYHGRPDLVEQHTAELRPLLATDS